MLVGGEINLMLFVFLGKGVCGSPRGVKINVPEPSKVYGYAISLLVYTKKNIVNKVKDRLPFPRIILREKI